MYDVSTGFFKRSRTAEFHENQFHKFENNDMSRKQKYTIFPVDEDESSVNSACNNELNSETMNVNNGEAVVPAAAEPAAILPVIVDPTLANQVDDEIPVIVQPASLGSVVGKTYEETYMNQIQNLGSSRQRRAPARLIEDLNLSEECNLIESLISDIDEPKSFKDAVSGGNASQWESALNAEYASLNRHQTWTLVPRPQGVNVVGSRWVFKVKRNSSGSIDRFKARLVAQGYTQTEGVDYGEVFSPVARLPAIRSLLALGNAHNLEIHQMDVNTAFLNGELDYNVYMEQPEGYVDAEHPDYVCKLNRSLYGLKQSARCWNSTLDSYMKSADYRQSGADSCIYIKSIGSETGPIKFVIMAIYVDDIIPVSNDLDLLTKEKAAFCKRFDVEDKGEIHDVLGMLITRDRKNKVLTISQPDYLKKVLVRFRMENCKSVSTPLEAGRQFTKFEEGDQPFDTQLFQQAIGCLTYASISTRPDIAAAVGALSQFMSKPSEEHWVGVKRILRYLKGTLNHGLCFRSDTDTLSGYSDADWAGDLDTRRSTSGYLFMIGGATVSWSSKKQATVAKSTTEAEYVALSFAAQEAIWLRRLMADIGFGDVNPTVILEDNNGAIDLSKNPKHHNRTKHIDIAYHFTRERVESKELSIQYCHTSDMVADAFTKGIGRVQFEKLRDMMGVESVSS